MTLAVKLSLGCIADDYTGASDLANTLTRAGLRTVQTIGVPSDDLALPEVDAVVVSLKSRSIEAGLAVSRSRSAEKWLRGRGADHVLFKICSTFDSTDAGNIGPVMDALRADSGDAIVLVTPAFPETGRTVYQGNLFVGAVPLNESPLKDHPLNPMHDSNLVRVLARQSKTKVGLVPLAALARGEGAVRARLADLAGQGIGAAIVDAVFDRDLETIGKRGAGSPAVGRRLRHRARPCPGDGRFRQGQIECDECDRRRAGRRTRPRASPAVVRRRRCSRSPTPKRRCRCCISIPTGSSPVPMKPGAHWPGRKTESSDGPVLIASSSTPEQVAALQSRHGRDAAGHAIEQAMADIADGLVQSGVRRLVVAGGETSGAVVDRLGHSRLSRRCGNRCRRAGFARGRRRETARCCLR